MYSLIKLGNEWKDKLMYSLIKLGNEWKDELMNSLMKVSKWIKKWINVFTDES